MSVVLKRVLCCLMVALLAFLTSCTLYEYAEERSLSITFGYSKIKKDCFVGTIEYSIGNSTEIVIPSTYNNYPVVQLGGYIGTGYPIPFFVTFNSDCFVGEYTEIFTCDDGYIKEIIDENTVLEVENIVFKIILPSKLKTIKNTELNTVAYAEIEGIEAKLVIFRPVYYFEISKENESFYTENGKLYYKSTGELFTSCIYEQTDYSGA